LKTADDADVRVAFCASAAKGEGDFHIVFLPQRSRRDTKVLVIERGFYCLLPGWMWNRIMNDVYKVLYSVQRVHCPLVG
jgi:hypothetical protein